MKEKIITKLKSLLKIAYKIVLYFLAIIGLATILSRFMIDNVHSCLDDGGVWDGEYGECRFDCYHWNYETGCEMISDEKMEEFLNGYCMNEGKGLRRCKMAKLEFSKRLQHDSIRF